MLRPATDADVDAIRRWRNQEPNRAVSINEHEITPDEHAAWWARTIVDPTRRVLIYERAGTPAGVVNLFDLALDGEPKTGSWGFFLDAEGLDSRGEILPAWIEVMRRGDASTPSTSWAWTTCMARCSNRTPSYGR